MTIIKCNKCNKNFANNYNLKRHQNICNSGGSKTNKQIKIKCKYCGKYFAREDSLTNHINKKRCKSYNKIQNEIKAKKNKQIINNTNSKRANINNIIKSPNSNNIYKITCPIIISFGKDGVDSIKFSEIPSIFGSEKNLIETLISYVNLDPKKPQHHNVLYSDTKSTYGEIYENKKWIRKKIDEILEILIESKIDDLNLILNDMKDFLNKKTRNKIKETIENFDCSKPGARKKLRSYLKPILYNHKDMIIKTRKLTKEQEEEIFKKEQDEAEKEAKEEEDFLKYNKNSKKKSK